MLTWIIETGIDTPSSKRLVKSAHKSGAIVHDIKFLDNSFIQKFNQTTNQVIFHGSIQAASIAKSLGWQIYSNDEEFSCKYYYPRLKDVILNSDYIFLPYGSLQDMKEQLFTWFGKDDCIFIRPDSNNKPFTGTLVEKERWKDQVDLIGFYGVKPEELCVISPPVNIIKEWRFFVSGEHIITGSLYRDGYNKTHKLATSEDINTASVILRYCNEQNYNPNEIWVMDMCKTKASNYYLLEVGSFTSSGIYAADTNKLVKAIGELNGSN